MGPLEGIMCHRKFRWYFDAHDKYGKEICPAMHVKFEERPSKERNIILFKMYFLKDNEAQTCKDNFAYVCDGYATASLYDGTGNLLETWDFDLITTIHSRIMVDGDAYLIEVGMQYIDVYHTIRKI